MKKQTRVFSMMLTMLFTLSILLAGFVVANAANLSTKGNSSITDPYQIDWYLVGSGAPKDVGLVENAVDTYLKDKINATVKLNILDWGSYNDKMQVMIASGQKFDLCFTSTWINDVFRNSLNGAFVDLGPLLDKYAPKAKAAMGSKLLKASQINGKNYVIPTIKELAQNFGFVYNKTLAQKYGIDMSKVNTLEKLDGVLKIIYAKEGSKKNFATVNPYPVEPSSFYQWNYYGSQASSVGVIGPDGKTFVNQYETTDFRKSYSIARQWYMKGYNIKDAVTSKVDFTKPGNFFVFFMDVKPGYAEEQNPMNKANGWEEGVVNVTKPVMSNGSIFGACTGISRTSQNPERVAMFLNLMMSDKYLNNLITYGIEGKHYKKTSANAIQPIADSGYNIGIPYQLTNSNLRYLMPGESPTLLADYKKYNESALLAPDLGFIFNPTPVKTEMAACDNIVKQYSMALSYGVIDPAKYYTEFIDKLKAAGASKIVAEKQKQFDAWKKTQKK